MRIFGARLTIMLLVASGSLVSCSPKLQGIIKDENDFQITNNILFATQISPQYNEVDADPWINTSYLVTIDRGGKVNALEVEPMEGCTPIFLGESLIALDRKFTYRIKDSVNKVDDPKPDDLLNDIVDAGDGLNVFAVLNHGAGDENVQGEYRMYTRKISLEGVETTELEGVYLHNGVWNGQLYGIGTATGRVRDQLTKRHDADITAFVKASGTSTGQEELLAHTRTLMSGGSNRGLTSTKRGIVELLDYDYNDNRAEKSFVRTWTFDKAGRVRPVDHTLIRPDKSVFAHTDEGLDVHWIDRKRQSDHDVYWLSDVDGVYWQTDTLTGVTTELFQLEPRPERDDGWVINFTMDGIQVLDEVDGVYEVRMYDKSDGHRINTIKLPDFQKLLPRGRHFWGLAASPQVK